MKTIYKILFIALAGCVTFTACNDDIERTPSPAIPDGCQGVFFPAAKNRSVYELEPAAPTEITLTISRTDSTQAVTVPIKAEINEQNIFNVPASVQFGAGEASKSFAVSFPSAKEGSAYILKLSVEGDEFVNLYNTENSFVQTTVTRIKWEDLDGPGVMLDGIVGAMYGTAYIPFYVEIQTVKVGNTTRYRLLNPYRLPSTIDDDGIYNGYPYNKPDDIIPGDYVMVITIDGEGNVSVAPFDLGMDWGYGMMSGGSYYGNLSSNLADHPLGTIDGDVIFFPASSLYLSDNDGAFPGKATTIYLTKEAYLEATSKINDYNALEYESVDGAINAFESAAFESEWDQPLWKAVDQKPNDEESPYLNLFYLPDLYSEGAGLAFYVNGEKITIPPNQPTGVTFLNNEIFVSPSEKLSSGIATTPSTGLKTYSLGLNFHTQDGASFGDFTETFFFGENEIARSIDDFCGWFNLNATNGFDGTPLEFPVKIEKKDNETLIIKGLLDPFSAELFNYSNDAVIAEFKASENCAILEGQQLDNDFVYQGSSYPLYLFPYASSSEEDLDIHQPIRIICRYNNVLKFTSQHGNTLPIDGYGFYVGGLDGFIDNLPYNITLTPAPVQPESGMATKAAPLRNTSIRDRSSSVIVPKSNEKVFSFKNFASQPKSFKENKPAHKLSDAIPVR
jgi:hypothetical protein